MNPDDAYKPQLRLTVERKGFGGGSSYSQSYEGGNPDELISSVSRDLVEYRTGVKAIGTRLDNPKNRKELDDLRADLKEKLRSAKQELDAKQSRGEDSIAIRRLSEQLDNQCKQFEELLKLEKEKLKNVMETTGSFSKSVDSPTHDTSSTAPLEQVTIQESALEDRERQAHLIEELERDIIGLNEIATDLNVMVGGQGEQIEEIEQNVERGALNVEEGTKNLSQAVVLKRKNRTMLCFVIAIVGGIILIIVIVVVIVAAVVGSMNS